MLVDGPTVIDKKQEEEQHPEGLAIQALLCP